MSASKGLSIRALEYSPQAPTLISPLQDSAGFVVLSPMGSDAEGNYYQRVATLRSRETRLGLVYVPPGSGMLVVDIPRGSEGLTNDELGKWLTKHPKKVPAGPSLPDGPIIVKPE